MLSREVADSLSPEPILTAFDHFCGSIVDLDHGYVIDAEALQQGRAELENRLPSLGLDPGDRVIVAVGNGPRFVATLIAILAQRGSPLLVHAKTPSSELRRTALRFGARFLITDECSLDDLQAVSRSVHVVMHARWLELRWAEVDTTDPAFDDSYVALPGVPLHPTSGTTGLPKIAVRPGACAIEEARHYVETIGVTSGDVILAVAPMSHAYAYGMCVMVPLLSGASVVTMRDFGAKLVFQALQRHRVTILPAVPAMLDVLTFGAGEQLRDRCRCVLSAGAPLPERTARRFVEKSGTLVRPLYGTTETGGITVTKPQEGQVLGGCVGQPMQGVEVEVRPAEVAGADWEEGMGMLHVRSSSMMAGYLGKDGVDRTPLDWSTSSTGGWFKTGDLARIDSQGAIHLMGRESDVINVSGMKVIPSEVEEVMAAISGVMEVKIYAGQTRSGSQMVKAAVVTEGELDIPTIRQHCQQHLVYYKRPDRIISLDALPRSPSGKIVRDQLP